MPVILTPCKCFRISFPFLHSFCRSGTFCTFECFWERLLVFILILFSEYCVISTFDTLPPYMFFVLLHAHCLEDGTYFRFISCVIQSGIRAKVINVGVNSTIEWKKHHCPKNSLQCSIRGGSNTRGVLLFDHL